MEKWQIISYLIYFPIAIYIIIVVGWKLYQHGRVYILTFFSKDEILTDRLNNLLLLGYYLINIGFAFLAILIWPEVSSASSAMSSALGMIGKLCLLLGILHVNNKACIVIYAYKNHLINHQNN